MSNFTTSKQDDSTHMIDDGMIYWIASLGKTSDEVAAMFRDGYDGDLGAFDVTDLATDEREDYAE